MKCSILMQILKKGTFFLLEFVAYEVSCQVCKTVSTCALHGYKICIRIQSVIRQNGPQI